MKSDTPTRPDKWGKETVYYFDGSRKKSVRLPERGKDLVRFNRALVSKLPSLGIDWRKKPERKEDAAYIGAHIRRNPRYISGKDTITLLKECYRKTKYGTIAKILEDDFDAKGS